MDTENKNAKHTETKESLIIQANCKVTKLTVDDLSIKKIEKNLAIQYNKSITVTENNAADKKNDICYETVDNTDNLISFPRIHGEGE